MAVKCIKGSLCLRLMHSVGMRLVTAWAALLVCTVLPAHAERRIALVIGVDRYEHLPRLEKAVADARAVAKVLREDLGFSTVLTEENADRRAISRKLAELDGAIQPGDTVFFFFSGHGVALGSDNVLLPADMPKPGHGQDGIVRDDGFAVDGIVRRIQGRGAKVALLVLDACRDNPFEQVGTRSIGATRGLTRIDAPTGVFVLFSAGLGQKALDRLPGNDPVATSVFTRHLIPALQTPGLSHVQIAKRVQLEVDALAKRVAHAQQPAYYDQIIGDVVLRAGTPAVHAAIATVSQPTASQLSGTMARGWLGLSTRNLDAETAKASGLSDTSGALVQAMAAKGPADVSGVKMGDAILTVNGSKIKDTADLELKIAEHGPNTVVEVRVMRGKRGQTIKVKLGQAPVAGASVTTAMIGTVPVHIVKDRKNAVPVCLARDGESAVPVSSTNAKDGVTVWIVTGKEECVPVRIFSPELTF